MQRIGMIGCGQLARMMAMEGARMGMAFVFVAVAGEDTSPVAGWVGGRLVEWHSPEDDSEVLAALAECSVIITEREDLPPALLDRVAADGRLRPGRAALEAFARRDREREALTRLGLPVAPFLIVTEPAGLQDAVRTLGGPLIIKTVTGGYDGKGQWRIADAAGPLPGIPAGAYPLLLERLIKFDRELSITAVRAADGEMRFFPLSENTHRSGILVSTRAPAVVDPAREAAARQWISHLMTQLDYIGVLTIELFETADGLLVNEVAPRVHNSAHWTLGGAVTSQFENHLLAVTGAPLGMTDALRRCGIVNVLGQHAPAVTTWMKGNMRLHDYGKKARPGRKLGHVLVLEDASVGLEQQLQELAQLLAHV